MPKLPFHSLHGIIVVIVLGCGSWTPLHAQSTGSAVISTTQTRQAVLPPPLPTQAPAPPRAFPVTTSDGVISTLPEERAVPAKPEVDPAFLAITSMQGLENTRKLNVGDRLTYRVVEDRDEPQELFINDTGEIEVPYLGRHAAQGKTCKELAASIKADLEKELYYQSTVIVGLSNVGGSRGKVYVTGYVRGAGEQDIPPNVIYTVSKAVMRAGGFGDFADQRKVKVHRRQTGKDGKLKAVEDTEPIIVDVKEIIEKGRVDKDIVLQPDDYIFVPQRLIVF